jgi:hypothetical protein
MILSSQGYAIRASLSLKKLTDSTGLIKRSFFTLGKRYQNLPQKCAPAECPIPYISQSSKPDFFICSSTKLIAQLIKSLGSSRDIHGFSTTNTFTPYFSARFEAIVIYLF